MSPWSGARLWCPSATSATSALSCSQRRLAVGSAPSRRPAPAQGPAPAPAPAPAPTGFVMEAFAVPSNVVLGLKGSGKRKQQPPEHEEQLVTKARHVGPHAGAVEYNLRAPKDFLGSSGTVRTWLFRWRQEGTFGEVQRKWGRKQLFEKAPVEAQAEWDRQVDSPRSQGESTTGRVSACKGRAAARHTSKCSSQPEAGALLFSTAHPWAII